MIEELEQWLKDHQITYKLRRNEIVTVPGWGRALYQDMEKREHIFKQDPDTKEVHFNCIENYDYLRNDDVQFVLFKFGDAFYWLDINDPKEEFYVLKHVGEPVKTETQCKFYPLGIHSGYELLNGSGSLALWCETAKFLGYGGISACDYNTLASSLDLQREATAAGLKYCFGYSLTFEVAGDKIDAKIYSQTQEGFQNLLRIQYNINVIHEEDKIISITDLCALGKGNVIVFDKLSGAWLANEENDDILDDILDHFEAAFFQVDLSEYKADRIDSQVLQSIKAYFDAFYISPTEYELGIEPVLIQDMYYCDYDDCKNKNVLSRIASGAYHEQSDKQYMKNLDELFDEFDNLFSDKYSEDVFYRMCENTARIIEPANAAYDLNENYMPEYEMTPEEKEKYSTNLNMFNQLLEEGLKKLAPEGQEERYRKQMEYERYVILSTENLNYFLFTYDLMNWARSHGIMTGIGRGSAGGCLVSYLLGITLVDPIHFSLIFERFLLPERGGLTPAKVTKMQPQIESDDYFELMLENGKTYKFDRDAEFLVKRGEEEIKVYADELQEGDDIIFDNKDLLFTL